MLRAHWQGDESFARRADASDSMRMQDILLMHILMPPDESLRVNEVALHADAAAAIISSFRHATAGIEAA